MNLEENNSGIPSIKSSILRRSEEKRKEEVKKEAEMLV